MDKFKTETTRRALVAGLAAAPVAGLAAVAGPPVSKALAQAIERHRATWAAYEAAGLEALETDSDEFLNPLHNAYWDAFE